MKKTFRLRIEGKNYERVAEASKHEIRQYIKREKRKTVPSGSDYWGFDCKFGVTQEDAKEIKFSEITPSIDQAVALSSDQFYIEILAKGVSKDIHLKESQEEV